MLAEHRCCRDIGSRRFLLLWGGCPESKRCWCVPSCREAPVALLILAGHSGPLFVVCLHRSRKERLFAMAGASCSRSAAASPLACCVVWCGALSKNGKRGTKVSSPNSAREAVFRGRLYMCASSALALQELVVHTITCGGVTALGEAGALAGENGGACVCASACCCLLHNSARRSFGHHRQGRPAAQRAPARVPLRTAVVASGFADTLSSHPRSRRNVGLRWRVSVRQPPEEGADIGKGEQDDGARVRECGGRDGERHPVHLPADPRASTPQRNQVGHDPPQEDSRRVVEGRGRCRHPSGECHTLPQLEGRAHHGVAHQDGARARGEEGRARQGPPPEVDVLVVVRSERQGEPPLAERVRRSARSRFWATCARSGTA